MVSIKEDPETRFAKTLVRLLKYFNFLEKNVGLCISHLANPSVPKASYPFLSKMTAEQKMNRLRELFESKEVISEKSSLAEFENWFERAARARYIRNRYVHGQWEYLPLRSDKPVGISAHPWMRDKLGSHAVETMSMDEFEAVADELVSIFEEFMRIRRKHGV